MIVYGSSMSPYVRKVLAFAHEKGLPFELKTIGLGSPDPEFKAASPFGKMPALRDGDFTIADSTAIVTYLEAKQPEPNLIPTEARARARTIWFDEFADTILFGAVVKIFFNRVIGPRFMKRECDHAVANQAWEVEVPPILDYLEKEIPEGLHLVEGRLTLADIAVAGPLANLEHAGCTIDPGSHPKVAAFADMMLSRPSFLPYLEKERRYLAKAA